MSALLRESKRYYFKKYFQIIINDFKSTWKGINTLTSLKESPNIASSTVIDNSQSIIKPEEIRKSFNKYFVSVTVDIQCSIKFSKNDFHDFLPPLDTILFSQTY